MGLLDSFKTSVLTVYEADISGQKAALADLTGAEQQLAESELEAAEARAQQHKDWLGSLGTVTLAIGALAAAGKIVWDGYKEGIQEAKLANTAMGVDLDRLSTAAGGLQTHLELLTFAAKATKSAFGNTQDDMEIAQQAMRALEERGIDATTAYDAVTNAVVGLKTKGLAAMGVFVDTTKMSFDASGEAVGTFDQKLELHSKVMESLKVLAKDVADGHDAIGDSMKRAEVSLSDSWAELKKGMGELVGAMAPLLQALGKAVSLVGDIVKATQGDGFLGDVLAGVTGTNVAGLKHAFSQNADPKGTAANDKAALLRQLYGDDSADFWKSASDALTTVQGANGKLIGDASTAMMQRLSNQLLEQLHLNFDMEDNSPNANEQARKAQEAAKKLWEEQVKALNKAMAAAGEEVIKNLEADAGNGIDLRTPYIGPIAAKQLRDGTGATYGGGITNNRWNDFVDSNSPERSVYSPGRAGNIDGASGPGSPTSMFGLVQGAQNPSSAFSNVNGPTGGLGAPAQNDFDKNLSGDMDWWKIGTGNAQQELAIEAAEKEKSDTSLLEKTFGKVGEFDLYKKAFEGLTKAATSSFDAWISGSMSASEALKHAIGQMIESLANQMLVESLKNFAYSVGSLAMGDFPAAGRYALAGAEFAAGALLAGVLAKEMGSAWGVGTAASSSASGGGAGAGSSAPPTSPASSSQSTQTAAPMTNVIVVGDGFTDMTPRMKGVAAQKYVDMALGQQRFGATRG